MKIEWYRAEDAKSLESGRQELWIRALSKTVLDLPRVLAALPADLRGQIAADYEFSHCEPDGAEDTDGSWSHGDWWIFTKTGA